MTGASGVSDADLVAGVLAGDRDAFAQVYDKYADRLHDFAYSMLRQREDAMDAVADAFVTTAYSQGRSRSGSRSCSSRSAVVTNASATASIASSRCRSME